VHGNNEIGQSLVAVAGGVWAAIQQSENGSEAFSVRREMRSYHPARFVLASLDRGTLPADWGADDERSASHESV
jgi:hypothetical protein